MYSFKNIFPNSLFLDLLVAFSFFLFVYLNSETLMKLIFMPCKSVSYKKRNNRENLATCAATNGTMLSSFLEKWTIKKDYKQINYHIHNKHQLPFGRNTSVISPFIKYFTSRTVHR